MTDRPTPEADALHEKRMSRDVMSQYFEMLNLSRRLERERDEARDAAEKAKAFKRVMKEDNAKLRRELEAWKESRK